MKIKDLTLEKLREMNEKMVGEYGYKRKELVYLMSLENEAYIINSLSLNSYTGIISFDGIEVKGIKVGNDNIFLVEKKRVLHNLIEICKDKKLLKSYLNYLKNLEINKK